MSNYPKDTGYPLGTTSGAIYIPGSLTGGATAANLSVGGSQQFETLAERDNIPVDIAKGLELDKISSGRRSHLMRVGVTETGLTYELRVPNFLTLSAEDKVLALADNTNWFDTSTPKIDETNLVHKTDDEIIAGNKTFTDTVTADKFIGDGSQLNNLPPIDDSGYAKLNERNTFRQTQRIITYSGKTEFYGANIIINNDDNITQFYPQGFSASGIYNEVEYEKGKLLFEFKKDTNGAIILDGNGNPISKLTLDSKQVKIISEPIESDDVVNKAYVDSKLNGASIDESNLVHKTGNETINDNKTFTDTVKANKFIGDGSSLTNVPNFVSVYSYDNLGYYTSSSQETIFYILTGEKAGNLYRFNGASFDVISQDRNNVHKTGDETINGNKKFTNDVTAPHFIGDGSLLTNLPNSGSNSINVYNSPIYIASADGSQTINLTTPTGLISVTVQENGGYTKTVWEPYCTLYNNNLVISTEAGIKANDKILVKYY